MASGRALTGERDSASRAAAAETASRAVNESASRAAAEAAARGSYGKLVALLAARTRDIAAAEDALAEAFAAALRDWPESGVPDEPDAWLLAVARRRAIDAWRRARRGEDASAHVQQLAELASEDAAAERAIPDRRLELLFACAHPAIDPAVRAPLLLQAVLGFDAATIASAFLVSPAAMSQRLVRAKAKIRDAGVRLAVPEREALAERLDAVLAAIYAAYTEGWQQAGEGDPRRRALADEAIWLGRVVVALLPEQPEAIGLLALMLHAHARRDARRGQRGEFVPLRAQDPRRWDAAAIDEAENLLRRASARGAIGRYQLEAAIQSAHNARRASGVTDWVAIAQLYGALCELTASPVAALSRAVALAEAESLRAGLAALATLADEPRLRDYQPYWAARAELCARCGERDEARAAYRRALGLEPDAAVRAYLAERMARLGAD